MVANRCVTRAVRAPMRAAAAAASQPAWPPPTTITSYRAFMGRFFLGLGPSSVAPATRKRANFVPGPVRGLAYVSRETSNRAQGQRLNVSRETFAGGRPQRNQGSRKLLVCRPTRPTDKAPMPRYYFDLVDDRTVYDSKGVSLPNEIAAKEYAATFARELMETKKELLGETWKPGRFGSAMAGLSRSSM